MNGVQVYQALIVSQENQLKFWYRHRCTPSFPWTSQSVLCSFTNFCSSLYFLRATGLLPNASQWASICELSAVKVLEDINRFPSSGASGILHKCHSFWNSNDLLINNYWIRFSHDIMNYQNLVSVLSAEAEFIMSSSQAIVNWLNALDQSDFS